MVTFDFAIYTGGLEEAHPNIEVGRLIHATKAHRNADLKQKHGMVGDRGPYRCLSCNEPVNRSGGYNIQDAHFRHYHDSACNGGSQETARHILMKEGIGQLLNLQPNITAEVEKRLPGDSGKQPDVTVTFDSGEFFIEAVVTHPRAKHH